VKPALTCRDIGFFNGNKHGGTSMGYGCQKEFHLNDFHRINKARQHEAFSPPHPITALVACVAEEVGELAAAVLGVTGEKKRKAHLTNDDVLDAVADAMTYLSLVASAAGCDDLEALLAKTFNMVSKRAGSKLFVGENS
jgi:NTP pyrophosphatase (non-canonical NTP hydrolase)